MKKRRILTALLAMVMLLSAVPFGAMAAGGEQASAAPSNDALHLTKTATLTEDGSYTIDLEAYATGTTIKGKGTAPLDIVLVLDQSGSMNPANNDQKEDRQTSLKNAAKGFIQSVYQNGVTQKVDHRIGLVTFARDDRGSDGLYNDPAKEYLNSGVYDETGKFIKYPEAMNGVHDAYKAVQNPDETKQNYYYGSASGGQFANYGEYAADVEAKNPQNGDGKNYFDASGKPLSWITIQESYKKADKIHKSITYYIDKGNQQYVKLSYSGTNNKWNGDDGKTYRSSVKGPQFYPDGHVKQKTDALILVPGGSYWSADGKTLLDSNAQIFEHQNMTGWHVGSTPVETVYKKVSGESVFSSALISVSTGPNGSGKKKDTFDTAITNMNAEGATRVATGIELANKIFENNPIPEGSARKRVMIVFTDGEPGVNGYEADEAGRAVEQAYITKHDHSATVYTIGLYASAGQAQENFMNYMSSNYPDARYQVNKKTRGSNEEEDEDEDKANGTFVPGNPAADKKYYKSVKNASNLDQIFKDIQKDIIDSSSSVKLDATAIMRDIMAQGFEMTSDSKVNVKVVPGTKADANADIVWKDNEAVQAVNGKQITVNEKQMTIQTSTTANKQVDVTGFSYMDQFVAEQHPGSKLVAQITGVKALPTVANDQKINTNDANSGIWQANGKEPVQAFPNPDTYMPAKSYVVDYAKPLDLKLAEIKMNRAVDVDKNGYNPFATANTDIAPTYGNVNVTDGKLTYTPKTMNWDGGDTFYVFGTTDDATVTAASANAKGNVWAKVNVIPANNVYYEDTFKTDNATGTVGITYTGNWTNIDVNPGDNPGAESSGDNHGWIDVFGDELTDSDGTSHKAVFENGNVAKATFTFTGTGVDIYSRTSPKTGTVVAMLRGTDDATRGIGATKVMDTLSASGEYYQIPTLTFHEYKNKDTGKMVPLPHGAYSIELLVSGAAQGRYEYYLDGIRVYNPAKGNAEVENQYNPSEQNAAFMEVRDKLLHQGNFNAELQTVHNGPVFIDQLLSETTGSTTSVIGVYEDLGPKNEVYLKAGQSIAFAVDHKTGNNYQVGLKSINGKTVNVKMTGSNSVSITHTADMYYDVVPENNMIIITNNSDGGILSVTKLKVTNANADVNTAAVFADADVPTLLAAVQAFNEAPDEPEVPTEPETQPTEPETQPTEPETQPTEPETQPTEPETQPTEPDVDIENPTEPEPQPEKPSRPSIKDILDKIFGGIRGWH